MIERNNSIWIFNSADSFSGNPKWLFMYIYKYRKDIKGYWLCYNKYTLKYVRKLGFKVYLYNSRLGKRIMQMAGVYVVEQCKEVLQPELDGIKILNLWHGVGCKTIEIGFYGFIEERIIKKYIVNYSTYKNNQLFLVTSPLMEKHFIKYCNLDEDKMIRAGYPRCIYQENVNTFNHNLLKKKNLRSDTKIAVYAPTYRNSTSPISFFSKAIPSMEELIKILWENNILLIFKMHPLVEADYLYNDIKKHYKDCPYLLFWDNLDDIYEIFSKIDLAIIDYSSIFYDLLACGVKHFIRYMFDIDDEQDFYKFVFDIKEMTCGRMCDNFESLLNALKDYGKSIFNDFNKREDSGRINELFWSYTTQDSNNTIINRTLEFKPDKDRIHPTLYSFDIFNTIIERKTLHPHGIFFYVRNKINFSENIYSTYFKRNFIKIRTTSEARVREYYKKSVNIRRNDRLEITFDEIYDWMGNTYQLNQEQINELKRFELEAEFENCMPIKSNIDKIEALKNNGETVLLISDMYLPEEFLHKMLIKADPILGELPIFLSSTKGVQKTTRKLYIEAFRSMDYHFGNWIHCGDNQYADITQAKALGIDAIKHEPLSFNKYHNALINYLISYEGYLTAALMAHFEALNTDETDIFVYSYISLYLVPYVGWVVKDAVQKGYECLYFISRDGYHLKNIADEIIKIKKLNIKTRYIYGSRRAWRIPSYISKVDDDFFELHGNLSGVQSFGSLLKALSMNEETFNNFFPEIENSIKSEKITQKRLGQLTQIFKNSTKYQEYLLNLAKEKRKIVLDYLRQEINLNESFAFVEYWGRGYTQDCLVALLNEISEKDIDIPYYYLRSIYPTMGHSIRYNFTTDSNTLLFMETIFANLHYESVESYVYKEGCIEPVINPSSNDMKLQESMERYLPAFCRDFYSCGLIDEDEAEKRLNDFALFYFFNNLTDPIIVNGLAHLKDSVEIYGRKTEFAPIINFNTIKRRFINGEAFVTKSMKMSIVRSSKQIQIIYNIYNNYVKKNKFYKKLRGVIFK